MISNFIIKSTTQVARSQRLVGLSAQRQSSRRPYTAFTQESKSKDIAIVGYGHRARRKFVPALDLLGVKEKVNISCIVDPNTSEENFQSYPTIESLVRKSGLLPNFAFVAPPHDQHKHTVKALLEAGIDVLKEKPLAINHSDAEEMVGVAQANGRRLSTLCQRRFSERYQTLGKLLPQLGKVSAVHVKETISVPNLDIGWRAERVRSGGGVVLDMGYHMLDQLVALLGDEYEVVSARIIKSRHGTYSVEDTAYLTILFQGHIFVTVYLSRSSPSQQEEIEIIGEQGSMHLDENTVYLKKWDGSDQVETFRTSTLETASHLMSRAVSEFLQCDDLERTHLIKRDLAVMRLIDNVYVEAHSQQLGSESSSSSKSPMWTWPCITSDTIEAVKTQLNDKISIAGDGNVFMEFETAFKNLHESPDSHALLHNSGTNALHALYYAAGISPGDEVIVPVYTFHATVSPLMQLGAKPVFVDTSSDSGSIDPMKIKNSITSKTKAVVVTHMWGFPCDMPAITQICKDAQLLLLEDCSHAHGATINGQMVGTFGDGAAWSIQGEKIVSGGEGGISLTRHADFYYRQLLHGHYNKRCRTEIPKEDPLHAFALTGTGLKNRAHPLAVAVALTQLKRLPSFLTYKRKYADLLTDAVASIPFLKPLDTSHDVHPAWYAFIVRFDSTVAPHGLTRELFVKEVEMRGFKEIDIPNSTRPLFQEPLYTRPWEVLPHLYSRVAPGSIEDTSFPRAAEFHESIIKMPVWGFEDDIVHVNTCIKILKEAGQIFLSHRC